MSTSPLSRDTYGNTTWTHQPGDQYVVTGTLTTGQRFRQQYDNWFWARGINLCKGSKWLLRDGKRYLISRVSN